MMRSGWVAGLAVLVAACGGGSTPSSGEPGAAESTGSESAGSESPGAQEPGASAAAGKLERGDVTALFARETSAAAVHAFSAPDGSVKASVEASAAPAVTNQVGFVMIVAKLLEHDVQCFVYPESKDGAEVARVLIGATLDKLVPAADQGWVDVHGDQVGGWPYLVARAHYLFPTDHGKAAGDFKIAVSVRGETTVACVLDAPGYYASFERVLRSLLGSLESAANRGLPKPHYAEITRTSVPQRVVTLSHRTVMREKGKLVEHAQSMELMIGPTGALRTSDDASSETSQKGRLASAVYASVSMGQVDHMLELTAKGDRYEVKGTLQGKPFQGSFEVKGGLIDDARSKSMMCQVRDGKKASVEIAGYEPSVDPQSALAITVSKSPTPDAHLVLTFPAGQEMQMKATLDEDCDLERGSMVTAGMEIPVERIWHEESKR